MRRWTYSELDESQFLKTCQTIRPSTSSFLTFCNVLVIYGVGLLAARLPQPEGPSVVGQSVRSLYAFAALLYLWR